MDWKQGTAFGTVFSGTPGRKDITARCRRCGRELAGRYGSFEGAEKGLIRHALAVHHVNLCLRCGGWGQTRETEPWQPCPACQGSGRRDTTAPFTRKS